MNGAKRAFGYFRVSSEDQVRGESLGVQRERIQRISKVQGLSLADIFVDEDVSGSKPLSGRPEGAKLFKAVKSGDTIVALCLDRAFRSTTDALQTVAALKVRGVRLFIGDMGYIAGDAAGELHLSMLASFATFERRRCQERIIEAKRSLRARGRYAGGSAPFGYRLLSSPTGERTRHGSPVCYLEPVAAIHDLACNLLAKNYSSRLARCEYASRGYQVSHDAIAGLFRKLRAEQAAA
jgi:putative DNA-invertase from lambdoid prophage Rac